MTNTEPFFDIMCPDCGWVGVIIDDHFDEGLQRLSPFASCIWCGNEWGVIPDEIPPARKMANVFVAEQKKEGGYIDGEQS